LGRVARDAEGLVVVAEFHSALAPGSKMRTKPAARNHRSARGRPEEALARLGAGGTRRFLQSRQRRFQLLAFPFQSGLTASDEQDVEQDAGEDQTIGSEQIAEICHPLPPSPAACQRASSRLIPVSRLCSLSILNRNPRSHKNRIVNAPIDISSAATIRDPATRARP